MGAYCSCPLVLYFDLDSSLESVALKCLTEDDEQNHSPSHHSIGLKRKDSDPSVMQSLNPGKSLMEGFVRLRAKKLETSRFNKDNKKRTDFCKWPRSDRHEVPLSPKNEAALKLQKVYKSFRTRRKLADCAVLIEQSWWKLLDFAELKHSSISFFDIEQHETAISRWSRARTRAAKVGKGLSKNSKAQKLALQHWLEAIDPRHRYGHNLHFYYVNWLNSQSKEPFFYWLDVGEGKEVNLIEKCSRIKLQQQCIKYLGPMERKAFEVVVVDGKLIYKQTGEPINTTDEPQDTKWIFVLSTSRTMYVGKKKKGSFQHSSFLAGGATLAAGRVVAENGVLKAVWPHSGHYRPTPENFQDFILFLKENNMDLTDVKLDPIDEDEESSIGKKESIHLRNNSSEEDLTEKDFSGIEEKNSTDIESEPSVSSSPINNLGITTLQIPIHDDLLEQLKSEIINAPLESPTNGYESSEDLLVDETEEEIIPEESILQRISSHKEMKSFQLGKQLSFKWSTGAGPRIGCVRDYPNELQSHALEQVNLSPRSQRKLRFGGSSRSSTPNSSSLSRCSSQAVDKHRLNA